MVMSAFSSGYQNDAPTRRFLITIIVVIVVIVVVFIVLVVVIIVIVPPAASRSRGNFHIKIPHWSRLDLPGAVNINGCPGALLAVASGL